jgi:hypothetical protein
MLTKRILPREEWETVLAGRELGAVAHRLPDETSIIVIERDGVLVGCWSLTHIWQAEGLWMAPEEAQSPSVGRKLLLAMREEAHKVGTHLILTGATTDPVRALLTKVGAEELPIAVFAWPMGEET